MYSVIIRLSVPSGAGVWAIFFTPKTYIHEISEDEDKSPVTKLYEYIDSFYGFFVLVSLHSLDIRCYSEIVRLLSMSLCQQSIMSVREVIIVLLNLDF